MAARGAGLGGVMAHVGPIATTFVRLARGQIGPRPGEYPSRGEATRRSTAASSGAASSAGGPVDLATPPDTDVSMEASQEAGAASAGRRRLYCPVIGCPEGNCARSQGWIDPQALRKHMEGHASGRFSGDVPRE